MGEDPADVPGESTEALCSFVTPFKKKFIGAIDVGYSNPAFVVASVGCTDNPWKFGRLEFFTKIALDHLPHERVPKSQCELYHTLEVSDLIDHYIQEFKPWFDLVDVLLIERQPPTGMKHVEQLLFKSFRDKTILVHPGSMHCYFGINDLEYEQRKERTVQISDEMFESNPELNEKYQPLVRKHDIGDGCAYLKKYIQENEAEWKKQEYQSSWEEAGPEKPCPECKQPAEKAKGKNEPKKLVKAKAYENKLKAAFYEEYAKQDGKEASTPTTKFDSVETIRRLSQQIQSLVYQRIKLFAYVRDADIEKQAREYFGVNRKYSIIHADCPWDYPNQMYNGSTKGKYKGMADEDLFALPVEGLCRENAVLLFWATFPKLDVAINCIYAWGFRYTTCFFAWCKLSPKPGEYFDLSEIFKGSGSYTRNNVEVCLLGVRGDITKQRLRNASVSNVIFNPPERNPLLVPEGEEFTGGILKSRLFGHHEEEDDEFFAHMEGSCVFSAIGEHSEKPKETYEKIVRMFGDQPRIDLFARRQKAGWDHFGNQVGKFPPDQPIVPAFDNAWKARQDRNADFSEKLVRELDKTWENRETMEIEMVPRKVV